jgi:hypothetical protein
MPVETIVVVSAIVSVFVAFAALLTLADITSCRRWGGVANRGSLEPLLAR